jgi:hypothetical protein
MGPRAGLDDVETRKLLTLLGLEFKPIGRPARSQPVASIATALHCNINYIHSCV